MKPGTKVVLTLNCRWNLKWFDNGLVNNLKKRPKENSRWVGCGRCAGKSVRPAAAGGSRAASRRRWRPPRSRRAPAGPPARSARPPRGVATPPTGTDLSRVRPDRTGRIKKKQTKKTTTCYIYAIKLESQTLSTGQVKEKLGKTR